MLEVNNVEQIRNWLRDCPIIVKSNRFGVDYVSERPTEYAVYAVPSTLKYHENILGEEIPDSIQTQNFIFASKEPYGSDSIQNAANLGFYQEIATWIIEQNAKQNFPEWDGGRIKSILPTLTGAPVQTGSSSARYQIQIRVTYRIK